MAPRALSTFVLASKNELKRGIGISTTDTPTDDVEDALSDALEYASGEIEKFLNREIVTRGGSVTEYHTAVEIDPSCVYLGSFPATTITSVDEGSWSGPAWVSTHTLVAGTDYLLENARGMLTRIASGDVSEWPTGIEKIRIIYTTRGYANTAAVPQHIRRVAVSLAGRRYMDLRRGQLGASSVTDAQGSITRFMPAELLRMEQEALFGEKRFHCTGRAA